MEPIKTYDLRLTLLHAQLLQELLSKATVNRAAARTFADLADGVDAVVKALAPPP